MKAMARMTLIKPRMKRIRRELILPILFILSSIRVIRVPLLWAWANRIGYGSVPSRTVTFPRLPGFYLPLHPAAPPL